MYGSNFIRLMGIDPGTLRFGLAIIDYDLYEKKILISDAWSLYADKLAVKEEVSGEVYGERFLRILALKDYLLRLLEIQSPNHVFCETPFFNMLRPSAFQPLAETLFMIKTACYEYNPLLEWKGLEPKLVKKTVGVDANADKKKMKDCMVAKQNELNFVGSLSSLDEHAIDALAVAYSGLYYLRSTSYAFFDK